MSRLSASNGNETSADETRRTTSPGILARQRRSRADVPVLVAVVAAFGLAADEAGLAVGIALVLSWFVLPTVAVFAAGVIGLTALVPTDAPLLAKGLPLVALGGLLATTTLSGRRLRNAVEVAILWIVSTAVVLVTYRSTNNLSMVALALAVLAVVGFIGLAALSIKRSEGSSDE